MSASKRSGFTLLLSLAILSIPAIFLGADLDRDGIEDPDEERLARGFLPLIWYRGTEFCPEPGVILYHVRPYVPGGSPDTLSISYCFAYYEDCGTNGHAFDPESFALTLYPLPGSPLGYGVHSIRTWAHRGSLICEETEERIYNPSRPGVPVVGDTLYGSWEELFVSSNKHGVFLDEGTCDGHCFGTDDCGSDLLMNAGRLVTREAGQFFHLYNIGEINDPMLENFREIDDIGGHTFGDRSIWGSSFMAGIHCSTAPGPSLPAAIEIIATYGNPLAVCEEQSVSFRLPHRSLVKSAIYDIAGNLESARYLGEFCGADTIRTISWFGLDTGGDCLAPANYYLVLEAYRGDDGASDTDDFGIGFLPGTHPASPADLRAEVREDRIDLSWEDRSSIEDGFILERREGNCAFGRYAIVDHHPGTGTVSYSDIDVEPAVDYTYRLFAYRTFAGYSDFSNEIEATIPECRADPFRIIQGPALGADSVFSGRACPVTVEISDPECPFVTYEWSVYGNNCTEPGTIVGSGTEITYIAPDLDCEGTNAPHFENRIDFRARYQAYSDSASTGWFTIFCPPPDTSGCPFLYVWDGERFQVENNLLPLSEMTPGNVTDACRIGTPPVPIDDRYLFEIREDGDERSFIDRVELLCIDHRADTSIGVTTGGTIFGYTGVEAPGRAVGPGGEEVIDLLLRADGAFFMGNRGDEIEVDFGQPGVEILVMKINPGPIQKSFGPFIRRNRVGQSTGPAAVEAGMGLPRHLGIPQFIEAPSLKEDFSESSFTLSWMGSYGLDFIGAIRGRIDPVSVTRLTAIEAVHTVAGDVRSKIEKKDGNSARLLNGERVRFAFPVPERTAERERDFILVVNGYYRH